MSNTSRSSLKPKNLSLLEMCQSIQDFRQNPNSNSSSQSFNRHSHQQSSMSQSTYKISSTNENDKKLDKAMPKKSSNVQGLAVLSSSLPLTARYSRVENRNHRRRISKDFDQVSSVENDFSSMTSVSFTQSTTLPAIGNGSNEKRKKNKSSSKTLPDFIFGQNKSKSTEQNLNRKRINPIAPPTTPLHSSPDFNSPTLEREQTIYQPIKSIQQIQIHRRKATLRKILFEQDDHVFDESLLI